MSATFARTAAPKYALLTWADANAIYLEIPAKDPTKLPPLVMAFSKTEGGLTKALAYVTRRHSDFAGPQQYKLPEDAKLPTKPALGSTMQQAHAQAVLRRLGVFK